LGRLKNQKVLVAGLGASGISAVKLLAEKGARPRVSELKPMEALSDEQRRVLDFCESYETGTNSIGAFRAVDLVVISPGVPMDIPAIRAAKDANIPVISEIELAWREIQIPVAAITGTNGKSTVTTIAGEILRESGRSPFVGGNLGKPFSELAIEPARYDCAVIELSSFQLETCPSFKPKVAVVTNISQDHQDRYADHASYVAAKANIFAHQTSDDFAVLNRDNSATMQMIAGLKSKVFTFGWEKSDQFGKGAWMDGDRIIMAGPFGKDEIDISKFLLPGRHNRLNLMAAALSARLLGASSDAISRTSKQFVGLSHRLQFVAEIDGVKWYDDSKATTIDSVIVALEALSGPVVLLLGGYDKGADFAELIPALKGKVKLVVCFGTAGPKIQKALENTAPTILVPDFASAMKAAAFSASPGDQVALSPACASFDEFTNYAARGEAFRRWVLDRSN